MIEDLDREAATRTNRSGHVLFDVTARIPEYGSLSTSQPA